MDNTNMARFKPVASASIIIDGAMNTIESGVVENYILSNYTMSIVELTIKQDKLDLYLDDVKAHQIVGVKNYDLLNNGVFDYGNNNIMRIIEYIDDSMGWYINVNTLTDDVVIMTIFTKGIQTAQILFDLYKKYEHSMTENVVSINTISLQGNNISFKSNNVVKNISDFDKISKDYYPFLDTDEMFKQFLLSKDKMLILGGEPGTGKTKIIDLLFKYSINNINLLSHKEEDDKGVTITAAYIKNTDILSVDALWSHLNTSAYDFIILDDMDNMLTDRNATVTSSSDELRKKFISQFLSFTDGLFNKKTKFIITTNQSINTVDKALLRKGRCFDILTFRKLKKNEYKIICENEDIKGASFDKLFKDEEELLACDISSKIDYYKNSLLHKDYKPYILESGISIMGKVSNKKIKV